MVHETAKRIFTKHGAKHTVEYETWSRIISRCLNKNDLSYKHYGGRGIQVCEKWRKFEGFVEDMGLRPSNQHSIGRVDNDGNYEPSNCRWENDEQQRNNKRTNVRITANGETLTAAQWSRKTGIPYNRLLWRVHHGWSNEKAVAL